EQKYSTYMRITDVHGTTNMATLCSIYIRIPSSSSETELWVEIHYNIAYSVLYESVYRFHFSVYVNVYKKVEFADYDESYFTVTICNDEWAHINNPLEAIALYMKVSKEDLDKSKVVKDVVDRDMIQTFIIETFNKLEQSLLQETS
ncbi:MAG TPA: hypothetical protein PLW93_05645, partial [Candidatus Absconditabacterales bacterium]|nr:hypothetical protein [Candidatus Absconditabacterales bacterium]